MKDKQYEEIQKQQLNNYIMAVKEIINNNTTALVEDDITSLISKPPLDSMDSIKNKYLEIAKKNKIILNMENTEKVINEFRNILIKNLDELKKYRVKTLVESIENFSPEQKLETIKISKKELNAINKKINSNVKKIISSNISNILVKNIDEMYIKFDTEGQKDKVSKEINKYFTKTYLSQLMENINIKILVKDTTLINGVREQGERYIFTQNNSRINEI